jgi:acyl-CoA thioester hydrolase
MQEKRIEIRWRDMDAYGHVNNAVYLTYLEAVRDLWLETTLGQSGDPWDYVLARVAIDFRHELRLNDQAVIARCSLMRVGNSSLGTREEIVMLDGTLAAQAEAVIVTRDPRTGRSRPLNPKERPVLEAELLAQQEADRAVVDKAAAEAEAAVAVEEEP